MTSYYLDTSIWIDLYEKRGANGERALRFLLDCISKGAELLYSDLTMQELRQLNYSELELRELFAFEKTRRVSVNREQQEEARRLASRADIPRKDALHAVIARDNGAVLVSNDRDFQKVRSIVEVTTTYD